MTKNSNFLAAVFVSLITVSIANAETRDFDTDKMMSELEKQLELSKDKLDKLRPVLEEKSRELEKSVEESIEKGYLEMEALSQRLKETTEKAEKQLESALNSEEVQKLHDYLDSLDEIAIEDIGRKLADALAGLLRLTEDQISKTKPILEDGFKELAELLDQLTKEGERNMEAFKNQYEGLSDELMQKLQDSLNDGQFEKLEEHREELREKIREDLFIT